MLLGFDADGDNVCSHIWPNDDDFTASPRCNNPVVRMEIQTL